MAEDNVAPETESVADAGVADEWTPPTKEEWEALQSEKNTVADKLKKANAESADRRKKLAELERQNEDSDGKAAREAAEAAKYKPFAIKAAAKAAFIEQGANSARVDRLFRMLDLERIDFDGDDIAGLEEQVAELKADVPELFSAPSTKDEESSVKPPKLNVAGKRPAQQELTPGDVIARQVFGR